jgi:hypothetical protein
MLDAFVEDDAGVTIDSEEACEEALAVDALRVRRPKPKPFTRSEPEPAADAERGEGV